MRRILLIGVVALGCAFGAWPILSDTGSQTGKRLFEGDLPLKATLRHSTDLLPTGATTCKNCHTVSCDTGRSDPLAAPVLGPNHLLTELQRISGPPVAYDRQSFCRVLTSGRTPAHTVTARLMPQYIIDEQHCADIWKYLIGETHDC